MRDSKITFRVSDDLLDRVDEIEESRSEIMREALRSYLEGSEKKETERRRKTDHQQPATLDDVLRGMIRETVEESVEEAVDRRLARERENVNVTVNVPDRQGNTGTGKTETREIEGETENSDARRTTEHDDGKTCHQCGEEVADEHVHCPNCGAKTAQRVFCDCGDEIRSDWSFCPSCGRRTPTSHALGKE